MNSIYVLQDETGYVVGATYEQTKALDIISERKTLFNSPWTYREIPFYSCAGTIINVIAGPIPAEQSNSPKTHPAPPADTVFNSWTGVRKKV